MKKVLDYWYLVIIVGFFVFAAVIFGYFGEGSYIAVHDNLDLFIPQYQMMKNTGSFWGKGIAMPFLGGVNRDTLPAEFSLYTVLYMIFPAYAAYIAGYLLKIIIAILSCYLLARDFLQEEWEKYRPLIMMVGFAYGILNVFPNFGIAFASIPLVVFLLRRIYHAASVRTGWMWYVFLLLYPLLSYFSYFGLFILAYLVVAVIWLWIRDKKLSGTLVAGLFVLAAGYVICEYRLFYTMLFSNEETIRSTMVESSLSAGEIMGFITESWGKGIFHAESLHTWVVLPVCILYFLWLNGSYVKAGNIRGIFHDVYNLLMLILVFNSVIYGIYYWGELRGVIEFLVPPLTGWQFNRTIFFSPFIWYAAFFLVLKRMYENGKRHRKAAANILSLAAVLLIVLSGTRYNDLYYTCYYHAYEWYGGNKADQLSYREFYSTDLFEMAKADIGYDDEWSAAYGFYPAVLQYNGIATLDGYLGFYSQDYKEKFRQVIAPALERVEESRIYFDEWGARAYLYSGTDISAVSATREVMVTDYDIYIDTDAFVELGGRYLFSRLRLTNAEDQGLVLLGNYQTAGSPYELYVYAAGNGEQLAYQ